MATFYLLMITDAINELEASETSLRDRCNDLVQFNLKAFLFLNKLFYCTKNEKKKLGKS